MPLVNARRLAGALLISGFLIGFVAVPLSSIAAPVVANPAAPAEGKNTLDVQEAWRVGGEGMEDYDFFGYVSQVLVDENGHSYLLDQQLCEVKAFDAEGNHLATFGREGEAPGEFRRPQGLLMLVDGRIGVLHGRPTRISCFQRDGSIDDDIVLGAGDEAMGFTMNARSKQGHVVLERSSVQLQDKTIKMTQSLVSVDPAGQIATTFLTMDTEQDQQGGGGRRGGVRIMLGGGDQLLHQWALAPDGSVYVARSPEAYEIEVYAADGTLLRTIQREYERQKRSDAEMKRRREQSERMADRFGGDGMEVDELAADIDMMLVRENGELWVLPSSGAPEPDDPSLGTFDVFDTEGKFVRQVEIRAPFRAGRDDFTLHGDQLYVVEEAAGARQSMASGFGMVIIDGSDTEDDEEARPLSVVSYRLGQAN